MPVFKIDIEKQLGAEYWTNVYHCDVADLDAADDVALEVLDAERAIHHVTVTFTKRRVSDIVPNTDNFRTTPINLTGELNDPAALLPLFNVLRVDAVAQTGRPGRKYLRGCLTEGAITFDTIVPAALTTFDTGYSNAMDLITELCDEDGDPFIDWQSNPKVGMRQLRRGSKRRTQPIIP
jgi:hypothetical protein